MRLFSSLVCLLASVGFIPLALADTFCSADVPCAIGCCGQYNVCGMGPDYCGSDNCINNCDAKAECNPGDWDSKYVNSTTCPLNVCCSKYGFCGTTEEFCGNSTVTRPSCDASSQSITRVIGYYNAAADSRSCDGMSPASIPQGVYSHLYFAFGSINPDTFEVIPEANADTQLYSQLAALSSRDLGQELWLSIGGWDFSDSDAATATTFSDLCAADTDTQNKFFKSLTLFMNTYGFTGVDIDWEYPAATDRNGRSEDYANYPKFLAQLKKALAEYKFGLSITLPTSYWYLQHFDVVSIEPSVDWFNFMSYDLHGTWDEGNEWTGAFLDAHTNLTEIETSLDLLWRNNITASKVNMGLAFYGRSFTLASASCSDPGCSYLSAGDAGNCSSQAGILFNSEIKQLIDNDNLIPTWHKEAAVKSIQWDGDQWVSFDDQDTWKTKADFAKSQCLGGVLVWSVDNDDGNQTFSRGLAAALGNAINVNTTTGITGSVLKQLSEKTTTQKSTPQQYCHFINCGLTCPNGYTDVVRADKTSQLMLDSTLCLSGVGTQTLCCPTSSEIPTCRWRGFHNNGKCKGGCNDDEAEVGTLHAGCTKSGYQSACCTITESTTPFTKCKWTSDCYSDDTCSSGYSNFVVGSRDGSGGMPSCSNKKTYNYCCSGSSVPDTFTNCDWKGHEDYDSKICTDSCPSDTIRIAAEAINPFNNLNYARTSGCGIGEEAYCCSGAKTTKRSSSSDTSDSSDSQVGVYQDQTARDFDAYLQKFLADPTCPSGWDDQYSSSFDSVMKREFMSARSTTTTTETSTEQGITLAFLLPLLQVLVQSRYQRDDLVYIWDYRTSQAGVSDVATIANMTTMMYGGDDIWTGTPSYDSTPMLAQTLCNIADSATALREIEFATDILCIDPSTGDPVSQSMSNSVISARTITVAGTADRSANECSPTMNLILTGILNGDLSLHYLRWLRATTTDNNGNPTQVILEVAFWIGAEVGVANAATRATYSDRSHTSATDRWVIFHLHIPLDDTTLTQNRAATTWYVGVNTLDVYHSQGITRPSVVTRGRTPDYRAEYRLSNTYARGGQNTGSLQNYNSRTETLGCYRAPGRWYIGNDRTSVINGLTTEQRTTPNYALNLERLSAWLTEQGVFTTETLSRLFPGESLADATSGWGTTNDWVNDYAPEDGAFDTNWLPNGDTPLDPRDADP
ncbi:uncharacterized protein N7511_006459 [Penicillium nucicola]|uniref:uncharacterized protein n=1 Tax=Penicillium nucicola TaxID=1850975 RepID=UPI0025458F5D|nr:uncharacterized protein N7511_006459 [Penicillium nucicola]KAJ5757765.1 hypothetical protein N7511_006459 [Penicillium nucicola]